MNITEIIGKLYVEGGVRRSRLQERVKSLLGSRAPPPLSTRYIYYKTLSLLPPSLGEPALSLGMASYIYNPIP